MVSRIVYCMDFNREKVILLIALVNGEIWDATHVDEVRDYTLADGLICTAITALAYPDKSSMIDEFVRLKIHYGLKTISMKDIPLLRIEGY